MKLVGNIASFNEMYIKSTIDPNFGMPTGANFPGGPVANSPMSGPGVGGPGMGPSGPLPGGPPMGSGPMGPGGPMPPHTLGGGPQPGTAQPLPSNVLGKGSGDRYILITAWICIELRNDIQNKLSLIKI